MTDEQFLAELSPEYLEWSEDPNDHGFSGPVEEIQRLCEVIVGLRARIAELEGTRAKAGIETDHDKAMIEQSIQKILECEHEAAEAWAIAIVLSALRSRGAVAAAQAAELAQLRWEWLGMAAMLLLAVILSFRGTRG
jgi:hypothetical protein